jgi:hypothetical protein
MSLLLGYDGRMLGRMFASARRSISAMLALFGTVLFLGSIGYGQINASHGASVAPPTHFNRMPPTVPVTPRTGPVTPPTGGIHNFPNPHGGNGNHPQHQANGTSYYPYIYPVPVPYAVDMSATDDSPDDNANAADQGPPGADPSAVGLSNVGLSNDDRRGRESYLAQANDLDKNDLYKNDPYAQDPSGDAAVDPAPDTPQPATTLIFKDGHQIEVTNYAIVSGTLYDLTPGHQRKVALADLDLPATEKQNDDRGVVFQLPASAQAN